MQFRMKLWHWILVALALVVGLDWLSHRPDAKSRELNRAIETLGSAELKSYPYQFRVLKVVGTTAVMATPRNVDVPAFKFLGVLYPQINVKDANDPAFIAVERTLGAVQAEARQIVLAQPGIAGVRWELDRDWLTAHYIAVPDK
jgi:hypothetical protein